MKAIKQVFTTCVNGIKANAQRSAMTVGALVASASASMATAGVPTIDYTAALTAQNTEVVSQITAVAGTLIGIGVLFALFGWVKRQTVHAIHG